MTALQIANLVLVAKDTNDKLTSRICRRLSLGIDVSVELDMTYLIQNYLFTLAYGAPILTDDNYNELLGRINRMYNKCNKFW